MASSTIFKNFSIPVDNRALILIGRDIASDKYKSQIDPIRELVAAGKFEEANELKKQLLGFTPSGTFTDKRLAGHLDMYSGYIHLDFDKLKPEELEKAKAIICADPHTFMCFLSPSGNGLKVFVEVDTGPDQHESTYLAVMNYYEELTGLKADEKCKDITRLCFVSHDPQLYKNIGNQKFRLLPVMQTAIAPDSIIKATDNSLPPESDQYFMIFQQQISFTNQKANYETGNRNNYMYLLASNCNRAGIPDVDTLALCIAHFDLAEREIAAAVKSAYRHHATEFAKFAKSAIQQTATQSPADPGEDPLEDYLKTTPTIPDDVYDALPLILREGARAFADKRKRDVFFTGAISILSGCLPNVTGVYFQERVYPHLYTFIIAPAASGKGVLKNAKRLAEKYHQKILLQSREAQRQHEGEMADFKLLERTKKKGEPSTEKPEKPPFKIVFIPADCSKARMIEHLKANDGKGIICETEADTMSGAKKQDWGDYSTILRAAFHHEPVSTTRKTENQYDEISDPCLAVALTGTPAQAPRLLSSAEDGLFSRFLFYAYKTKIEWQDPSPVNNTIVFNDHFESLSRQVLKMIDFLEQSPTTIELTMAQWETINTQFPVMLSDVVTFTSEDAAGVVYRMGLIFFRLCMILSALRKFENAEMTSVVFCTDEDFETAMMIVQTYLTHSLLMFNNLPKQNETMLFQSGDGKRRFFEALPTEFSRKQAIDLGSQYKLSIRTVDEILKNATGTALTKLKAGLYSKS